MSADITQLFRSMPNLYPKEALTLPKFFSFALGLHFLMISALLFLVLFCRRCLAVLSQLCASILSYLGSPLLPSLIVLELHIILPSFCGASLSLCLKLTATDLFRSLVLWHYLPSKIILVSDRKVSIAFYQKEKVKRFVLLSTT